MWKYYWELRYYGRWFGFSDISTVDEYRDRSLDNSKFLDECLTLFKGELSLEDILHNLPTKRLIELRDARVNRLVEEQKQMMKEQNEMQRKALHDEILKK